jgi:LmbE family N-acetylglucosaminyl deacetylase
MKEPLIVIAPHPDDEILGAGGIMARAVVDGAEVAVIVLTDGGNSDAAVAAEDLRRIRRAETEAGLVALLGTLPRVLFLEFPDGHFDACDPEIQTGSAVRGLLSAMPGATALVTDPADAHPDHKAAFGFTSRLVASGLIERLDIMPIGQRIDGLINERRFTRHSLGTLSEQKARALSCHRSQIDSPTGFTIPAAVRSEFCAAEYSRRVHDRQQSQSEAVGADHFESMFEQSRDPWGYDSEPYEADRFARTIAALGQRRYAHALELGCANGALTARLIAHCDAILATDVSYAALDAARARLDGENAVTFEQGSLPDDLPQGQFDLIVISDMLYYLGLHGICRLMTDLQQRARSECRIVITNYLGETDCALSGEMAAEIALAHLPGWTRVKADRTDRLRIEVLERP